jgi:hypothetical protein
VVVDSTATVKVLWRETRESRMMETLGRDSRTCVHPYHIHTTSVTCWLVLCRNCGEEEWYEIGAGRFLGRAGTCFSLETDEAAGQRALLGMDTYIRHTKSTVRGVIVSRQGNDKTSTVMV